MREENALLGFEVFDNSFQFVHPTGFISFQLQLTLYGFFSPFLAHRNMLKKHPYHKGISLWLMHVSSMMLLWPSPGKTASGTIKGASYFTHPLRASPTGGCSS